MVLCKQRIALDLETTGTNPNVDEILSLSIVDGSGRVLLDEMFRPTHRKSWPSAQKVNRITPQMVCECGGIDASIENIQAIFDRADEVVVYNAKFDLGFLAAAGVRVDRGKVIDAMITFAKVSKAGDGSHGKLKWFKLVDAAELIGYQWEGDPHSSLADAKATLVVQQWVDDATG